jgi:hypothetical protein
MEAKAIIDVVGLLSPDKLSAFHSKYIKKTKIDIE